MRIRLSMFCPNFLLEASDHAETFRKEKDCVFVTSVQLGFCTRPRLKVSIHKRQQGLRAHGKMGSMPLLLLSLPASMLSLGLGAFFSI